MANPFQNRIRNANNTPELAFQREIQKVLGQEYDFEDADSLKQAVIDLEAKLSWAELRLRFNQMIKPPLSEGTEKDNERLTKLRIKARKEKTLMKRATFKPAYYYHQAKYDLLILQANQLANNISSAAWQKRERDKKEQIKLLEKNLAYLQELHSKLVILESLSYDIFDE